MTGETRLPALLAGMTPVLHPETFVFATTTDPAKAALPALMRFDEAEGTTLILPARQAAAAGLAATFPCRMITLEVHSSLQAVGFIAAVAAELARHGIGVNPVAGFHHDHLFVPRDRALQALALLRDLSQKAAQQAP